MNKRNKWIGMLAAMPLLCSAQTTYSLQQLYDLAEQQSRQINVSQMGLQAAGEAVAAAKSAMLPTVNVGLIGSYIGDATLMTRGFSTSGTTEVIVPGMGPQQVSNGRQPAPHWGNSFSVQASQVIYSGGALSAGVRLAELGQQMAKLDVQKNRQEVRFLLTGYYLDLCKLHNQTQVVDQNIQLTQRLIANACQRHEQGTALKTDITRHELQLKSLLLTRTKLQEAAAIINHQIVTTLHLPEGTVIATENEELNMKNEDFLNSWQQQAAENNIGLRQASVARDMADQKVRQAQAASRPTVALVAEDNLFGPYTNDLIPTDANVNAWFVGVGIKYDLSSLWRNKHNVNRARLQSRQQGEQLLLASEGVSQAVQAAYTHLLTAQTEVTTQEVQVRLAVENYDVVQKRYHNDLALLTDMLDASNVRLQAEMNLADARIALLYCYYRLRYIANTL